MTTIGNFKKVGSAGGYQYEGEIVTLAVQARGVRIVPEPQIPTNKDAPSHRVYLGKVQFGAAWSKRSAEGRDYLSVKLDDPSFTGPIFANLIDDQESDTAALLWSRRTKTKTE